MHSLLCCCFLEAGHKRMSRLQVADALRDDLDFAVATSAAGLKAPGVGLYKQYDDRELVYSGKLEVAPLKEWLEAKSLPLVPHLDQ